MKTTLVVVGSAAAAFLAWRILTAVRVGLPVSWALKHPFAGAAATQAVAASPVGRAATARATTGAGSF